MIRLTLTAVLVLAIPVTAMGAFSEEETEQLEAALGALSSAPNASSAEYVLNLARNPEHSEADWRNFFVAHFENRSFTPALTLFWQVGIVHAGADAQAVARLSGIAAAAAVAQVLNGNGTPDSLGVALQWLHGLAQRVAPQTRDAVLRAFNQALAQDTLGFVPIAGGGTNGDPAAMRLGAQVALTFRQFFGGSPAELEELARTLRLAEAGAHFFFRHGVFLFDNGVLTEQQFLSLDSLLNAVPRPLHALEAVIVSAALGIDPAAPGLVAAGQVLFIEAIPMDVPTAPAEFDARYGQPVAPAFTIAAAQQLVGAIQQIQFARRPELRVRLDAVLRRAGEHQNSYLRKSVPPASYHADPTTLLPSVAFLWFIDAGRTFRQAYDRLQMDQEEAMDQFLLFADLMSGGGNTTVLHATSPAGEVAAQPAPLGRFLVGGRVPYANAITINGSSWSFAVNELGVTEVHTRR